MIQSVTIITDMPLIITIETHILPFVPKRRLWLVLMLLFLWLYNYDAETGTF